MIRACIALTATVALAQLAAAGTSVWTGAGADDRWGNPANWQNGAVPTAADDIAIADLPAIRQQTVTVDTPAAGGNLQLIQYGLGPLPFSAVRVVPGADLHLRQEFLDQASMNPLSAYSQTGGTHRVDTDLTYQSHRGSFEMSGGTLAVGGTLALRPENGSVSISGGTIQAGRLALNAWATSYNIAADAMQLSGALELGGDLQSRPMSLAGAVEMHGADFVNALPGAAARQVDLARLALDFDGSSQHLEVAGLDLGAGPAGFDSNFALGTLRIGGTGSSLVQLVNAFASQPGQTHESLYVDDLIIDPGGVLDLNGQTVYARHLLLGGAAVAGGSGPVTPGPYSQLIDTSIGGRLVLVPEPGALLMVALAFALGLQRGSRT